jgi:hypothetical protein
MFDIVKLLLQFESEFSNNHRLSNYQDSHSRWVADFFTSILPCALFVCIKDAWSSHFNADKKRIAARFLEAYRLTYGECYKSLKE